jgi:transketolase N-terminal domain/subunit
MLKNNLLKKISKKYRKDLFEKFLKVGQGHPGSVFSIIEILVCLFY